jgi:hypothetical protein
MPNVPHDISDLHFAPVVLALDARIEELSHLDLEQLALRVAIESDGVDWTRDQRISGLLDTVRHFIECHDWTLSWDPRGVRIGHGKNSIVLGAPAVFFDYVRGNSPAAAATKSSPEARSDVGTN